VKVAVVGAGAIGGYVGASLSQGGEDVTFIARGANLAAIQSAGMRVTLEEGREIVARCAAFGACAEAGVQDVVFLTVKAHQVAALAPDLRHLCGDDTTIVTMQNGIPWWYFHGHGGALENTSLESVDPGGATGASIDARRLIGSVVYPAASLVAPGVVKVIEGRRFTLGELDGSQSPRLERITGRMTAAGLKAPATNDIRGEIWLKLWGNAVFNPISALTRATLEGIARFAPTRELAGNCMREIEAVANALGITFRVTMERRIAGAESVGAHKTSMLQDLEAGKPLEIEALTGAVVELGRLTGKPTPHLDAIYAAVKLLAQTSGLA
jgi:2-dehydropantoate 2-reductase